LKIRTALKGTRGSRGKNWSPSIKRTGGKKERKEREVGKTEDLGLKDDALQAREPLKAPSLKIDHATKKKREKGGQVGGRTYREFW